MTGASLHYLDHAATCPLRPQVWEAMQRVLGDADFNAASTHTAGGRAAAALETARKTIAAALRTPRADLVFTGGGTQSDNLAVLGFARANAGTARILVSAVEHKAVLGAAERAAAEGSIVEVLEVDAHGRLDPGTLDERLAVDSGRPTLVSVMWANSEVGTVQPVGALCDVAHRHGALFHTDAVQAFGKVPVSLEAVPADLLTITAHKLGGPVGIGLLARKDHVALEPLAYGGSQERSLWPGTQNPLGAVGFAEALRLAEAERPESAERWLGLRRDLESRLSQEITGLVVHAAGAPERLPQLLRVGILDCGQDTLLTALDLAGIAVSAGSACDSGSSTGSHVLEAMGVRPARPYAVVRFSFGPTTTHRDTDAAADALVKAVGRLRRTGA